MDSIQDHVIGESLDVWFKFDHEDVECIDLGNGECDYCEEASHEANTYKTETGYRIEWYLNSVGLVTGVEFDTLAEAHAWYEKEEFIDFSS